MAAFFLYFPIFLILYVFTKHFIRKIQNLPPSPLFCLPIIGHLHLLKRPIFRTYAKIAAQKGPIFFLQLGNRSTVVVSSPSLAEECLTKNDINFASRPQLMMGKHLGNNYKSLAWSPYGDHWRNLRRIASIEVLSNTRLKLLSGVRADEVRLLMRNLSVSDPNEIVKVKSVLFELTLNMLTRMIAGKRYYGDNIADEEEAGRFKAVQGELRTIVSATNIGDFIPWLKSKKLEQMMIQCQKNREGFFRNIIEQTREKTKKDSDGQKKKTMIEVLLSRQESEPEFYSDDMIASFVLVLLVGGTETTITTMEWAVSLLLNHPEVLKKAQKEIDEVIGTDRLIEETDMPNLPYLRSIISETMRMFPIAPTLVPHESREECTVGGYRIPAGTTLSVNVWAIQNDPKLWADPGEFRPERFAGVEGMGKDGFRLMPFGWGRRACPGDNLALRVIGLTLGSLIQCFEWRRAGEELVDMMEGKGIFAKARPLEAKCSPRAAMMKLLS